MARAPRSSSVGISLAGVLVLLLAITVIGGTGYGYTRWQDEIAQATDSAVVERDRPADEDLPEAPDSPDDVIDKPEEPAYEDPTFDLLRPTENRPQPVVLVVGDEYAAGTGASAPDLAFPALLGTALGWEGRPEAADGAGYAATTPTLIDLAEQASPRLAPDLVVVESSYPDAATTGEAKTAVADLAALLADRYPGTPLVAISPFATDADKTAEARERTIARAWREVPGVLVLRPQPDGWGATTPDDPGHRLIADELEQALRTAGLAKRA